MINIIIPYFNSSKTIERALHSIAMQTAYRKVIVTIVDDCSDELVEYWDDKSELMIKGFTESFLYESVFPKFSNLNINYLRNDVNKGPGGARNLGLKNSSCDWIMFLDADDALATPLAIEIINKEIHLHNPDIFITRFQQQTDSSLLSMVMENQTWVHGKVFRTKYLKDKQILFPEIRGNEDTAFCAIAFGLTDNIKQLDFISCVWINNKASLVRSSKDYYGLFLPDFVKGRIFVYQKLIDEKVDKEIIDSEILDTLLNFYWQFIDLFTYRKHLVNNFINEVKNYLKLIKIENYFSDEKFLKRLKIRYWKNKKRPYYGPLIPEISFFEFYDSLISGVYSW